MNTDIWRVPLFTTLGCLLPILALSIIVAFRGKSIRGGLNLFLLVAIPVIGIVILLVWYNGFIPKKTQIVVGWFMFISSYCVMFLLQILYRNYSIIAGKLVSPGKSQRANNLEKISQFLILYCLMTMLSDLLYVGNANESMRRNGIIWLIAIVLVLWVYYSFEFHQKVFVYRGKVILFSDVEHAEWGNLMDKTELRLRLKNTDKMVTIKTPWEMLTPIDDYIKTNFPHP